MKLLQKFRSFFYLLTGLVFSLGHLSAQGFGDTFIDLANQEYKPVFTTVTIEGNSVVMATITDYDNTNDNQLNIKTMTYVVVPVGGSFERRVTQTLIVVTPIAGQPGMVNVVTSSEDFVTPVNALDVPTGPTTPATPAPDVTDEDMLQDDLVLPPSTEFFPLDEELNDETVVSEP